MGAIVTTIYIEVADEMSQQHYCGLPRWCQNAAWAIAHVAPAAETIIFTNEDAVHLVQRECPGARVLPFDITLVELARRWHVRPGAFGWATEHVRRTAATAGRGRALSQASTRALPQASGGCPLFAVLKLQVVDPRRYGRLSAHGPVLFLDLDVDLQFETNAQALRRHDVAGKLEAFRRDASCLLRAAPDHGTPVNTGVMLLKPTRRMYERGLALLRTRSFDTARGFNGTGSLRKALRATVAHAGRSRGVRKSYAFKNDTWDFTCAATELDPPTADRPALGLICHSHARAPCCNSGGSEDQGLFTTLYLAQDPPRFCVPTTLDRQLRVRHFWSPSAKPWGQFPSCKRYFEFLPPPPPPSPPSPPQRWWLWRRRQQPHAARETPCTRFLRERAARARARGRPCQGTAWPLI